jgi:hypothetical protein
VFAISLFIPSVQYAPKDKQADDLCATPPVSVCDQEYGLSIGRGSFNFTPGAWTHVRQTVSLNTPGQQDGSFVLEVDGEQVINRNDVFYRDIASAAPPNDSGDDDSSNDLEGDPEDNDPNDSDNSSDPVGPGTTLPTATSFPDSSPSPATPTDPPSVPLAPQSPTSAPPNPAPGVPPQDGSLGSLLGPLLNGLQLNVLPRQDNGNTALGEVQPTLPTVSEPASNAGQQPTASTATDVLIVSMTTSQTWTQTVSATQPIVTTSAYVAYAPYGTTQPVAGDQAEVQEQEPRPIGFTGLFFR